MWSAVEFNAEGEGGGLAPCARTKHAAALLGAHLYVLGGRGAGGAVPLRDFWRYSLAEGRWERLECGESCGAPPALQEHSLTAHGTKLYVFGGEPAPANEVPLWVYDTEKQIWRKLPGTTSSEVKRRPDRGSRGAPSVPRGRRGHSAHALKDCLLIYGGYKDLRGSTNELWAFHYESLSWQAVRTAVAGPARHRHAAALHGARLYVHGGRHDLRAHSDLWHYDTLSRVWTVVRTPARLSPSARCGHAGLRAGAHFYIFGGEADGHATNELWRFHFESETWERIAQSLNWPSPRVDCCLLLSPWSPGRRRLPAWSGDGERPATAQAQVQAQAQPAILREINRLSSFHIRRAARCSYSVLAAERDSTESLVRHEAALAKSRSAYHIDTQRIDPPGSPREGDPADDELAHEPISVPDFADMVLPTPVLTPVEASKLVYLDSEEEEEARREVAALNRGRVSLPKSASVRFTAATKTGSDSSEISTSDYASAERVNRLSGVSLGFSNPHYLGPDVRALGATLTPDSGVSPNDIELQDLGPRRARSAGRTRDQQPVELHLVVAGGREPPHVARLQAPLSVWTYRLL